MVRQSPSATRKIWWHSLTSRRTSHVPRSSSSLKWMRSAGTMMQISFFSPVDRAAFTSWGIQSIHPSHLFQCVYDRYIDLHQLIIVPLIGPIPWGHSDPLCHALSSSSSWTSMRRWRATVAAVATPGEWQCKTARSSEWAQHFSNASCWFSYTQI